ncbi:MAG: hypothetical protein V1809_10265 [Planctomycetota bacterium]
MANIAFAGVPLIGQMVQSVQRFHDPKNIVADVRIDNRVAVRGIQRIQGFVQDCARVSLLAFTNGTDGNPRTHADIGLVLDVFG